MRFDYSELHGLDIFENIRSRTSLRSVLGDPSRVLPKTAFSENSTDVFGAVTMKAWYSEEDIVSGVEIYYPEAEFYIFGKQVLGRAVSELEIVVKDAGLDLLFENDGSGVSIKNDTVRFYAPDVGSLKGEAKIDAVYISVLAFT